jgi:hypothetical protein
VAGVPGPVVEAGAALSHPTAARGRSENNMTRWILINMRATRTPPEAGSLPSRSW